ncbi:helix-turn-helix domain-containing protein [Myxococcota bacterium]|nr:helix-turn-helix domain-containing protein [Myxococcota bacterium]
MTAFEGVPDVHRLFGIRLIGLRHAAGLSQAALAARVGMDPDELARLEAGVGEPTVETVALLAEGLGVKPVELVRDENDPAKILGDLLKRLSPELRRDLIARLEGEVSARRKGEN